MKASNTKVLDPALLRREVLRPLGLMVGSIIWFPPLLMPRFGPRWSTNPLMLLWALSLYLILHLFHYSGLLHQSCKVLDGQRGNHQMNVSTETILKLPASPLLIKRHGVETTKVLEFLSVPCHWLSSLSQLEELYFLGVPHAIREVLGEEFPPEGFPSNGFLPFLHDWFHVDPLMLRLSRRHMHCESQSVICRTYLRVEDSLHVL